LSRVKPINSLCFFNNLRKESLKLIELRKTKIEELDKLHQIGTQEHTKPFLSTKSMADYKREFVDKNTTYLSIINTSNNILGYIILFCDQNENSIQLKRILIRKDSFGIGQDALTKLEQYCIDTMGIKRICLDVYEDNHKAIYIYEKLNYRLIDTKIQDNRKVLFFDKSLKQNNRNISLKTPQIKVL